MKPLRMQSLLRIAIAIFFSFHVTQRAHSSTWSQSASPHFSLYSENPSQPDRNILLLLERSRSLLLSLGMLNPAREHPITVFAFKDAESFSRYAPPHSHGFFQRGQAADYISLLNQRSDIILHEYAHAAIATMWPSLPIWMNEGLAGYYSTAQWGPDGVSVGGYLWDLPGAIDSLSPRLLPSILDASGSLIDADARATSQRYLLSWALVHMLLTEPAYAPNLRKFLDALSSGTSVTNALQSTYGRTLAQLQDDLGEQLREGRLTTFRYPYNDDRDEAGILDNHSNTDEFEVEIRLADLLSYHPSAVSAARVRLEQLSAQCPKNPEVEERLAGLSWRTADEAGVQTHMNNAYRRGSRNAELLIVEAQLLQKTGAPPSRIIPLVERALAEKPNDYHAQMLLGYFAYQNKDYARALALLKPIEDIDDPDSFVVLGSLAYSAAGAKDYSSAAAYTLVALKKTRSGADRTAMEKLQNWLAGRISPSTEPGGALAGLSAPGHLPTGF